MKFSLGTVVATPAALETLAAVDSSPLEYLLRHAAGDWGDIDTSDRKENEYSLAHGFRLLSAYNLCDGSRIWIITEADRSATTILLPDEY